MRVVSLFNLTAWTDVLSTHTLMHHTYVGHTVIVYVGSSLWSQSEAGQPVQMQLTKWPMNTCLLCHKRHWVQEFCSPQDLKWRVINARTCMCTHASCLGGIVIVQFTSSLRAMEPEHNKVTGLTTTNKMALGSRIFSAFRLVKLVSTQVKYTVSLRLTECTLMSSVYSCILCKPLAAII